MTDTEVKGLTAWINTLSPHFAGTLVSWIEGAMGPLEFPDDLPKLSGMIKLAHNEVLGFETGAEWQAWLQCRVIPSKQAKAVRHRRYQINFAAEIPVGGSIKQIVTPEQANDRKLHDTGAQAVKALFQREGQLDKWSSLKQLVPVPADPTKNRSAVKVQVHHLAARANQQVSKANDVTADRVVLHAWVMALILSMMQEVPSSTGRGSSIDHLCDRDGCVAPAHCVVANKHKDNIARINCRGVGLHHHGNVITGVMPCVHATAQHDPTTSCRRAFLLEAPFMYEIGAEWEMAFQQSVQKAAELAVADGEDRSRKRLRFSGSSSSSKDGD